ncbi:undecaprenyl-diphosphatase [Rhodoligotrophos appendicifer]|uniref:phosphatase PAP2 family protein n=1 Tax=Rhodoligotrophos appendicifer TaxID=987056 RepID=UPI0011848710|nr:phosphatase PAP2 family protein [Rhodoligotrophos appendicifer]
MTENVPLSFAVGLFVAILLLHQLAWVVVRSASRHGKLVLRVGQRIGSHQWVETTRSSFIGYFPRLGEYFKKRLQIKSFSGLPLTLLIIFLFYISILAGEIIQDMFEAQGSIEIDNQVNNALSILRGSPVLEIFVFITFYGTVPFMLGASAVMTSLLIVFQKATYIFPLWLTMSGATATTWGAKFLIDRPRPTFLTDVTEASPSFPSGHATAAVATFGVIAYLYLREGMTLRLRFEGVYWACTLIMLICFSRLVLGVHYLSDVVMGCLVGMFWLLIGVSLAEHLRQRKIEHASADRSAPQKGH